MSEDSLPKKADLVLMDLGMMLQSAGISLSDVFSVIDQDGDSTISPDEFRAGLFKLGIAELDEGEINRVIDAIDLNGDGQLDLQELQNSFNEHNMPTRIIGEKAEISQHDGQSMILVNTSSGEKPPLLSAGLSIGIVVMLVLVSAFLYVWLASGHEIEGTWTNPVQKLTFESYGNLEDSEGEFDEWRVDGENVYFVDPDHPNMEYYFRYLISNDVLFIAPLNYDDSVISEECVVFIRGEMGSKQAYFEEGIEDVDLPSWCIPE
jgi:hypothetical protein